MADYTTISIDKLLKSLKKNITYTINAGSGNLDINKTNISCLYFKNTNNNTYVFNDFVYERSGKDLKIITKTNPANSQVVTVKNYFTSETSWVTKSALKDVKYDVDSTATKTETLLNLLNFDVVGGVYNPNRSGVVTGTQFNDKIDESSVTKKYNKKGLTINSGYGNDTITGTINNDTISGGAGKNTVNFDFSGDGFGKDVVKLTKGETLILKFTNGNEIIPVNGLIYTKSGNNLVITKSGDDKNQVTVKNYFKNVADVYVNDSSVLTNEIADYLSKNAAVLNITGKGKFSGTDYNDNIVGHNKKSDTISTGAGADTINALGGNDTLKLGAGDKTVEIGYADGNDTITLNNTNNLHINIKDSDGNYVTNLVYGRNGNNLYIYRDNNQYTIVKNYFVKNEEDIEVPAVSLSINNIGTPVSDTTILNLSKGNKLTIDETNDGNYILGNKNDTVTLNEGDNNINLLKGNDKVVVGADYKDDTTIKSAGGSDTIRVMGYEKDDIDVNRVSNDIVIKADDENTFKLTVDEYQDKNATLTVKDMNNKVVNVVKSGIGKINGTNNNDILIGNSNNNTITGGKGDDVIYTRGGQDTVVLTGKYGHDIINAEKTADTDKVTLKMNSFNFGNIVTTDDDFVYVTDENNGVIYSDFFNANVADLWVKVGRTNTHIVNAKADYDNTKNTDINLVYLTADKIEYKGAKSDKLNIVVSKGNESTFSYQGGFEKYIDEGKTNTTYNATISAETLLELDDLGGYDTLSLGNVAIDVKEQNEDSPSGLRLFFNVSVDTEVEGYAKGFADEGYLLYDSESFDYDHIMAVTRGDTEGSVSIIENDIDETGKPTGEQYGKIENIVTNDGYTLDMDGWKAYVSDKVSQWLKDNNKTSVLQVLSLKQTRANKALVADLVKVYTDASYESYIDSLVDDVDFASLKNQNYSDLVFVKSGDNLVVKGITSDGEFGELFIKEDYFKEPSKITFIAKGDKAQYTVPIDFTSTEQKDITTFTDNSTVVIQNLDLTKNNTYVFEDKEYKDFYTKDDGTGHYTAGDPLIYKGSFAEGKTAEPNEWKKGGNNLAIGDVQIDNIDGKSGNIVIQDKDGLTKTIVVGKETINGTFESEIIVGSNSADTINALGGDDLIYSGDGNDTLNFVKPTAGEPTGNNTAPMIVIGGSDYLPANHKVSAISAYDTAGNDTYNTTLDVGLYVEDNGGTDDSLNFASKTGGSGKLIYMFDMYNPNPAVSHEGTPLYEDLFIYDYSDHFAIAAKMGMAVMQGKSLSQAMEELQGSFGYVWIDDYYGSTQKIENVSYTDSSTGTTAELNLSIGTDATTLATVKQALAGWLATTTYKSAWDVVESGTAKDAATLMGIYALSANSPQV